jgi:hypothetical protein
MRIYNIIITDFIYLLTDRAHLSAPIILNLYTDYYSIKHYMTGLHNGDRQCLLRGWRYNFS